MRIPRVVIVSSALDPSVMALLRRALAERRYGVQILEPDEVREIELHPGDICVVDTVTKKPPTRTASG